MVNEAAETLQVDHLVKDDEIEVMAISSEDDYIKVQRNERLSEMELLEGLLEEAKERVSYQHGKHMRCTNERRRSSMNVSENSETLTAPQNEKGSERVVLGNFDFAEDLKEKEALEEAQGKIFEKAQIAVNAMQKTLNEWKSDTSIKAIKQREPDEDARRKMLGALMILVQFIKRLAVAAPTISPVLEEMDSDGLDPFMNNNARGMIANLSKEYRKEGHLGRMTNFVEEMKIRSAADRPGTEIEQFKSLFRNVEK
jgi:hypothetical protein